MMSKKPAQQSPSRPEGHYSARLACDIEGVDNITVPAGSEHHSTGVIKLLCITWQFKDYT